MFCSESEMIKMTDETPAEKYHGKFIKAYKKIDYRVRCHWTCWGIFEMPTWKDAEEFLREARSKKIFVCGSITDDPEYKGYILRIALDPSEKIAEELRPRIKRRIYDPSPLYPDEDEVYEFYIGS